MGLGEVGSLQDFILVASAHGFQAIDADGKEIVDMVQTMGIQGAQDFLTQHAMRIGSFGLPVEWRHTTQQFQQSLTDLAKFADAATEIGCTACCTYILPSTDYASASFMAIATSRMRTCAEILDAYGISLGLEFVGPHHLRTTWKNPLIWTMDDTLAWIDAIDKKNVGLLLDAYHWYTTESTLEDLLALRASQVVHVHVNDAPNIPIPNVLDNDRLYPLEGVIDLAGFLRALDTIGYKGVVAQEVICLNKTGESSEELLTKSEKAFTAMFEKAGVAY